MQFCWDRYEAQGMGGNPDQRCPFCMGGVRCDLCSNGPCRADVAKDKRGVCGITGDGMAMRMMLLRNILGASTYHYHTEQTINTLRATAKGETPFRIIEKDKLKVFAGRLGITTSGTIKKTTLALCDFVEADFNRKADEPSQIVEALAPEERKRIWKKMDLFPGGIYGEMLRATSSCLTNVDGYYVSLALKALRLSIAMAYQSQIVNEYCQDIIFGLPRPHKMRVDLGVLDPDYVNALPNGHEPFLGFAMVQLARKPEWQNKARAVGAKGVRVIANIETGQEMIQRWEMDDVFYGFTGNWIMQEAVFGSGCVDLFACDMNCSMPIDPAYARKYKIRLVPVSDLVAFEVITERINYEPEKAEEQAAAVQADFGNKLSEPREENSTVTAEIAEKRDAAAAEIAEENDTIVAEANKKTLGEHLEPSRATDNTEKSSELSELLQIEEEPELGKPQWEVEIFLHLIYPKLWKLCPALTNYPKLQILR
jgi:carbon-monoxide dehydrogenase catalytic subunit